MFSFQLSILAITLLLSLFVLQSISSVGEGRVNVGARLPAITVQYMSLRDAGPMALMPGHEWVVLCIGQLVCTNVCMYSQI
jgi:hypothetical protein